MRAWAVAVAAVAVVPPFAAQPVGAAERAARAALQAPEAEQLPLVVAIRALEAAPRRARRAFQQAFRLAVQCVAAPMAPLEAEQLQPEAAQPGPRQSQAPPAWQRREARQRPRASSPAALKAI
jgi:hypothetical protein